MNLELLDPFAKTVPDHVDSVLSYGVEDATVCCFDKRGAYLAVGYATGVVVIWDFVTRGIGRVIEAHARAITALSWAKGGRRLLSASHDHRLHLWALDQARPELIRVICLDKPVMSALVVPGNYGRALALTSDGIAYMVDVKKCTKKALLTTAAAFETSLVHDSSVEIPGPAKRAKTSTATRQGTGSSATSSQGSASKLPGVLCLALDRRADMICLGTADGKIVSVRKADSAVSHAITVAGCSKVTQMDFSRDGKWMLVNSGERVIRMLERDSRSGKSVRDFQDVVNRTRWQCCCFTGDSEYVAGGSKVEASCSIYIWTVEGHLITRLEGPQVALRSIARHPVRPFLAAALDNGKVQLWGTAPTGNWTAFAADFEELEENVEYVEKEDEFDVVVDAEDPEGRKRKEVSEQQEDDVVVAIDAIDTVEPWSSDSEPEENNELFYLSTEPGAATREGWYDLEVQTSKGRYVAREEDNKAWTSVRVAPVPQSTDDEDDDIVVYQRLSGKRKKKKKKSSSGGSGGAGGKGSKAHGGKQDPHKRRTEGQAAASEGSGGGHKGRRDGGDGSDGNSTSDAAAASDAPTRVASNGDTGTSAS